MQIFNYGLNIQPGKYPYKDSCFKKLVDKFSPGKLSPYTVEFIDQNPERAEAVVFDETKRLDLIVADLEKIENRVTRAESEEEKKFLQSCQQALEKEVLLCDLEVPQAQQGFLKQLPLLSSKPSLGKTDTPEIDSLIGEVIAKCGMLLFFTAGKKEVRAWSLKKGLNILEAAGKIHSDLKRGFIKGEVVNCDQLDNFFNLAEARSRGLVKVVDRDYIISANDIIEIRFSV
ncbi:MAG: DUF933 domain-containing protein [Candidatus Omnitrophica bacterium]|nr:DUF933 domain-containing protein [Candidatus Omnitrophota bacterium]MBU2473670.1 DUF933 domain-containing protein [Candidatus Omnitrophota bacterium]